MSSRRGFLVLDTHCKQQQIGDVGQLSMIRAMLTNCAVNSGVPVERFQQQIATRETFSIDIGGMRAVS